jgi:hypothetical protein
LDGSAGGDLLDGSAGDRAVQVLPADGGVGQLPAGQVDRLCSGVEQGDRLVSAVGSDRVGQRGHDQHAGDERVGESGVVSTTRRWEPGPRWRWAASAMQAEHAPVVDLVSDRCERWIGRHNPLALFGLSVTQWCAVDDLYVVRFALPGGLALDQLDVDGQLEEEDQEPDVKTTFAQFGLAYYQASVLEHEIVNILAVTRLVATRRDAEQLLADPWDYSFKATMGPLVKQLEKHLPTDNELGTDLIEALPLRNHLAHAFSRERADDFCTDAGRMRDDRLSHRNAQVLPKCRPAVDGVRWHSCAAAMGRDA